MGYKLENLVTYDIYQVVNHKYIFKRIAIAKPQRTYDADGYIKSIDGISYLAALKESAFEGELAAINPRPLLARMSGDNGERFGDTQVALAKQKFCKSAIIQLQEHLNDKIEK